MFKHVPNILTMLRFVLIPFIFIAIIHSDYVLAFILLTLSGITDILDGFIARKFNFITNFGKLIDPLSDKATQVSVLAALCIENIILIWKRISCIKQMVWETFNCTFLCSNCCITNCKIF